MKILGLGGSDHDVSAAIVEDGVITCAIAEERVTRKKYGLDSNLMYGYSRKYVLNATRNKLSDMDLIVIDEILPETAYWGIKKNILKVNHHMLHAASTFFTSGYQKAAILIVDNAGSFLEYNGKEGIETITYAIGEGNNIKVLNKVIGEKYHQAVNLNESPYQKGDPDKSLGYFYKLISHYVGFDFIQRGDFYFTEDGKTMGLAPYGTDRYYDDLNRFVKYKEDGQIELDLRSGEFEEVLKEIIANGDVDEVKRDLAYAGQKIVEDVLVWAAEYLFSITECPNLCIAGGVGLNSVANGKILRNTSFNDIYIQPASGDGGTSLGAALYGYYMHKKMPRTSKSTMTHSFLGKVYTEEEIERALVNCDYTYYENKELYNKLGELLAQGKIVSIFQGGSEFGPRALGHRSILADPRVPEMKDILNRRVKFRENFRPFAPAVLFERQEEYFELKQYSPFMLIVAEVKKDKKKEIPSVVHIDGTARVQSVRKEATPFLYNVISAFDRITGVPVILNTSFNIKGQPIVETPQDAVECYKSTDIDCLAIGNWLLIKEK